jgi:hypothetical protein
VVDEWRWGCGREDVELVGLGVWEGLDWFLRNWAPGQPEETENSQTSRWIDRRL